VGNASPSSVSVNIKTRENRRIISLTLYSSLSQGRDAAIYSENGWPTGIKSKLLFKNTAFFALFLGNAMDLHF